MNTTYRYTAWDKDGKTESGVLGAENKTEAAESLRDRGYTPITIEERGTIFDARTWFRGKPKERLGFFRTFAVLQRSGLPPDALFRMLAAQSRIADTGFMAKTPMAKRSKERFVQTVDGIQDDVQNGLSPAVAMSRRPDVFTQLECSMVEIGITSGKLEVILTEIADFLKKDRVFSKSLSDALVYPMIVTFFAIIMVIFMVTSLIPQFASIYQGFGVELSTPMAVMLGASNFLKSPLFFVLAPIIIFGVIYTFAKSISTTRGAMAFDAFRLKIPVLGELVDKIVIARICRLLAMLTESGNNPVDALDILVSATDSPVYARALIQARDLLRRGEVATLHEALARTETFPGPMIQFIEAGMASARVPYMLREFADIAESDIASLTLMIPVVVQTLVTLVLGLIVGTITYAVYVPISQLVTQIH